MSRLEPDEAFEVALGLLGRSCCTWEHALGYLIMKSDGPNRLALKAAFPHVWEDFRKLGREVHKTEHSLPEMELTVHARYNSYHPPCEIFGEDEDE